VKTTTNIFSPPFGERKRIVIIGSGATGSVTALELARAGHSVTIIDAGPVGNGSSMRSAACIRQQFGTPSTVRGMIFATRYYNAWQEVIGKEKPIVQSGYLFLKNWTTNMEELKVLVQMQKQAGLQEVELLDAAQINNRFPYVDTVGVTGATWCPSDGFLYPDRVFLDASEAAKELGAVVVLNDEVIEAGVEHDSILFVKTKSGKIFTADLFINTSGVWAPNVSKLLGGTALDIKALRRYLYFINGFQHDDLKEDQVMTKQNAKELPMIITPEGCYCRPESKDSGRLMCGWLQFTNPIEPTFGNQDEIEKGFDIHNSDEYGWAVRKALTHFLPDIQHMGSMYTVTTGFYEDTPDHNPLIGFDPKISNLIHCAGFSGHGLMHAPFSAYIVSCLVAEGNNLECISLPFNIGSVDISTFWIERDFQHAEGLVI
jgi:sarcosine oxidase, subunit beta